MTFTVAHLINRRYICQAISSEYGSQRVSILDKTSSISIWNVVLERKNVKTALQEGVNEIVPQRYLQSFFPVGIRKTRGTANKSPRPKEMKIILKP
jgi:hypothetical protein